LILCFYLICQKNLHRQPSSNSSKKPYAAVPSVHAEGTAEYLSKQRHHALKANDEEAERNAYPQLPESLANLEAIVWAVMQFTFDTVYPDHGTITQKIRNGDLTFNWTSWVRWANPELNMSSEGLTASKNTHLFE
jgi:hypothetical protein